MGQKKCAEEHLNTDGRIFTKEQPQGPLEKVKSEKSRTRSNKVKMEENGIEIDGPSSSEEKKPNSYKRQETKKKNRKMSSVDFSDSDTEVENKETVIFQRFIPTKIE